MVTLADHSAAKGRAGAFRATRHAPDEQATWQRKLIVVFLVLFALPIEPVIADQMLNGPRVFVLLTFVPFLVMVLTGKAGRLTVPDLMMFGFSGWIIISLFNHYGTQKLPFAMITVVELLGGYLAGRVLVRSAADYRAFFQAYFVMLLVLLPFAFIEMMTGHFPLSDMLGKVIQVTFHEIEVRYGVFRAAASYPHPILWGLIGTMMLAQAWILWRETKSGRLLRVATSIACTVTAMSSAPFLALMTQTGLMVWGRISRNRWKLLAGLFLAAFLFLEVASNRGPIIIMIETMTLDPDTAWWRVYIWQYGTESVVNHPWFGIGLDDWERPEWLAGTVDNFWLLTAMRYGYPAIGCLVAALVWNVWKITRMRDISESDIQVRTAYMIGFVALSFILGTVHAWGAPAVLVMFYFGMGTFLFNGGAMSAQDEAEAAAKEPAGPRQHLPYSRFPKGAGAPRRSIPLTVRQSQKT